MLEKLWEPVAIGTMQLSNRLAMAAMTRDRATREGVPTEMNAHYYAQRASLGLVITEGTQPSDDGQGYMLTPGIYTPEQIAGWKLVTDAVHAAGGKIYIQIMHVGRIAHPANTLRGRQPLAPSAVKANGKMFTPQGLLELPEPRALSLDEIKSTIADFRHAAASAIAAGADGVEIHGANGYLVHQFLSDNANVRSDHYGGSIENRVRFAVEVAAAIAGEIGSDRTAIRISPANPFNDIVEGDAPALYHALVSQLAGLKLAYLHLVHSGDDELLRWIRTAWPSALMVNRGGRPREQIGVDVDAGLADLASVAQFALANPDLVARLKSGAPLNAPDRATFYGGDEHGYTDYPALDTAPSVR